MTRRRCPYRPRAASGFTLVEVMVAMAIGLAVVGALVAACASAFASGRRTDALVQITEDAALALDVMRQQVAQAGFSQLHGTAGGAVVRRRFVAVAGCEAANFKDLNVGILEPANCNAGAADPAAPDALEIAFEATVLPAGASNGILGGPGGAQPLDCLGNSFAKIHDDASGDDYWLNDSKFYLAEGNLYCHGPGNAAGAALVQNVEDLQIAYGMAAAPAGEPGAGRVTHYGTAPPPGSAGWATVLSVHLCVQVRSADRVMDKTLAETLGGWIDCNDVRRTAADGYLRRSFATTIVLHDRLP